MEQLRRSAREKGYIIPSSVRTLESLQSFLDNATLANMTVDGLKRMARENRVTVGGAKSVLLARLINAGITPPRVSQVSQSVTMKERPLESYTISQLRATGLEAGIQIPSSMRKAQIVQFLRDRGVSPPFDPTPFDMNECLTEWSEEYRKRYAEYYGVNPFGSTFNICASLQALQYDKEDVVMYDVTIPGVGNNKELYWPLPIGLTRVELEVIARAVGTYVSSPMTDTSLVNLLNRVVASGSIVTINYTLASLPLVILPLSNENKPTVAGCFNQDVPLGSIGERYTDKSGKTYCFDREKILTIRDSGVNPYTGKALSQEFLGLNRASPSPSTECTDCPDGSDKPCTSSKKLSSNATAWLFNWMWKGVFGKHKAVYYVPPDIIITLAKYKRCYPITVYRGLRFTKSEYTDYVTYNRKDVFSPITLNSWTTDRTKAEDYTIGSVYSMLLKTTLRPEDIFVDLNVARPAVSDLGPDQQEVIALPGSYQVEVIAEIRPQ